MTQSNDLPSRLDRVEDNIIDLRLAASALLQATDKNSADITALIEISRRNSETIATLGEVSRRNTEGIGRLEEAIQDIRNSNISINASIERMDRILDYLIRREQGQ
jgi:hypothetical protein